GLGGGEKFGRPCPHRRMGYLVEKFPPFGIRKNNRAERRPVQGTVLRDHPGTEHLGNTVERGSPGLDNLTGNNIRVNVNRTMLRETPGNNRLSGSNSAR